MTDIHKTLAEIIRSIMTEPPNILAKKIPLSFISAGDGKLIFTSQEVEQKILKVANLLYEQDTNVNRAYRLKEWQAIVRSALGRSLPLQIDNSVCFKAEIDQFKKRLVEEIEKHASGYGELRATYGCWLFSPTPNNAIEIGPVRFIDKLSWLEGIFELNVISGTTYSRLHCAFSGNSLEEREASLDAHHEETIRRQISNAPMVCEVVTQGLAAGLAYKRCAVAANLALTSISLIWPRPSLVLDRFRTTLEGEPHFSYNFLIASKKQKIVSWEWSRRVSTYPIDPEKWEALYCNQKSFLKIAGEMIGCWTSTCFYSDASELLRSLSQSLFFFWKGCREQSDLLSIVEFVAALEALAPNQKKEAVLKLVTARLGVGRNQEFARGKTLNQNMKDIYGNARSRTLHGTNLEFLHDWSIARAIAEEMTRDCLVECMTMAQDKWPGKSNDFFLTDPVAS